MEQGDAFYPRLIAITRQVEAKIALFEVADLEQALRVARMARDAQFFDGVEVWRDQPDLTPLTNGTEFQEGFQLLGKGNGRSVLCWTKLGAKWLGKRTSSHHQDKTI